VQDVLHPRLRPLEAGSRRSGSEGQAAPRLDGVDDAGHQRHLGPDDHEVGGDFVGEIGDRLRVIRLHGQAAAERGDARVAGSADDVLDS
jgi:hypothetical protein